MRKIKKISCFLLIILEIFTFLPSTVYAKGINKNSMVDNQIQNRADWDGTVNYNPDTKTLQIRLDAGVPDVPNRYYEYETIGYTVRYHRGNEKYIISVGTDSYPVDAGISIDKNSFKTIYNRKYNDAYGRPREQTIREISLDRLIEIYSENYPSVDFSGLSDPREDTHLYFNAIYATKPPGDGTFNGYIDANRKGKGTYYATKNGSFPFNFSSYNPTNAINISASDTSKGGLLGAKIYDTGVDWTNRAKQDINANHERYLIIRGSQKPDPYVSKKVTVNYKDYDTGAIIASSTVAEYSVNYANTKNHTEVAPIMSGYEYKSSSVNYGGGEHDTKYEYLRNINVSPANNLHEINFYYKKNSITNPTPSGEIKFNPDYSDWENQKYSVTVGLNNSSVDFRGMGKRQYKYYSNGVVTTGEILQPFTEKWEVSGINVNTFGGKNLVDQEAPIYLGNGSTSQTVKIGDRVLISSQSKNIQLEGNVSDWTGISRYWDSGNAPFGGVWLTDTVNESTSKPMAKLTGKSSKYNLDFEKPIINVNNRSVDWTNKDINLDFKMRDNLSGLSTRTIEIRDKSHYRRKPIHSMVKNDGIHYVSPYYLKYVSSQTLSQDGIYCVDGYIKDYANNNTRVLFGDYKLDKTKPNKVEFSSDDREYIDDELIVTSTVGDNLSGVSKIEYAVLNTDKYTNEAYTTLTNITTSENRPYEKGSFNVPINKNGTWYVHVWVTDRAGNVQYNISEGYKYFKIKPEDIKVTPNEKEEGGNGEGTKRNNIMRGARFDLITIIDKFTIDDANKSKLTYIMPNWVNDDVYKMKDGKYVITSGFGTKKDANIYENDKSQVELWKSFIPPLGCNLTYNKEGKLIGKQEKATVQLIYEDYVFGSKKTKPIEIKMNTYAEQEFNTQITFNE